MRNYQQSQEAICFNVECVLLQLTAIFYNPLTALLQYSERQKEVSQRGVMMELNTRCRAPAGREEDTQLTFTHH